jgi:hypothetical protein
MPKLIAEKSFTVAGKKLKKGDHFELPKKHAKVFVAIGKAKHHPESSEFTKTKTTKSLPAAQKTLLADPAASTRRQYNRRDMTAFPETKSRKKTPSPAADAVPVQKDAE